MTQFNSTFPLSLCLYMRDNGHDPVTVGLKKNGTVGCLKDSISMDSIVGAEADSSKLFYHFEETFIPYVGYSRNSSRKNRSYCFYG